MAVFSKQNFFSLPVTGELRMISMDNKNLFWIIQAKRLLLQKCGAYSYFSLVT